MERIKRDRKFNLFSSPFLFPCSLEAIADNELLVQKNKNYLDPEGQAARFLLDVIVQTDTKRVAVKKKPAQ